MARMRALPSQPPGSLEASITAVRQRYQPAWAAPDRCPHLEGMMVIPIELLSATHGQSISGAPRLAQPDASLDAARRVPAPGGARAVPAAHAPPRVRVHSLRRPTDQRASMVAARPRARQEHTNGDKDDGESHNSRASVSPLSFGSAPTARADLSGLPRRSGAERCWFVDAVVIMAGMVLARAVLVSPPPPAWWNKGVPPGRRVAGAGRSLAPVWGCCCRLLAPAGQWSGREGIDSGRLHVPWRALSYPFLAPCLSPPPEAERRRTSEPPLQWDTRLAWDVGRRGMVVDMGFFGMLLLLLVLGKVMAMRQLAVVVFVGVPRGAMLPILACSVMMGEMVVIVAMDLGRMRMLGRLALPFDVLFDVLWDHWSSPFVTMQP